METQDLLKNLLQAIVVVILLVLIVYAVRYIAAEVMALYDELKPGSQHRGDLSRGDKMSVGGDWVQQGTYGHTGSTLPAFGLSGYYQSVPTPSEA